MEIAKIGSTGRALAHVEVQIRDEASVRSGIPPEQFAFLKTCLHPQPARRFRDGNAAAEELESV